MITYSITILGGFYENNINFVIFSISPGTIATEMVNQVVAEDGTGTLLEDFILMHPLGRIGKPEEIGATAVFLASDGGAFVNGADFRVDGALTITPRTRPGAGSHSKE